MLTAIVIGYEDICITVLTIQAFAAAAPFAPTAYIPYDSDVRILSYIQQIPLFVILSYIISYLSAFDKQNSGSYSRKTMISICFLLRIDSKTLKMKKIPLFGVILCIENPPTGSASGRGYRREENGTMMPL